MDHELIEIGLNFDTHPRVLQMARLMKTSELHIVGCLWKLWAWAREHDIDSHAGGVPRTAPDLLIGMVGFTDALLECGWLEETGDGLRMVKAMDAR